ncbi:MAG: hypothetical protein IPJ98_24335 [Bryobacterales bacterium]|nr:hypothetical protein [Bryobacterales bacterium]
MNTASLTHPQLSLEEWDLVHELLAREWSDLAVEIRHTSTSTMKDQLHKRRDTIHALLERLWPDAA